jgi:hypothetical protein
MLKLSVTGVPDACANGGRLDWSFKGRLRRRELDVPGAQCFIIYNESCRVELEQLLKACIQYAFSVPVAIERCCGINANHAQNCYLANSGTRLALARVQNNSRRFQQADHQLFLKPIGVKLAIAESSLCRWLVIDCGGMRRRLISALSQCRGVWSRFRSRAVKVTHAACWVLISVAGRSAPTGAPVACMLVAILATPVVDRPHLPSANIALSAVVSLMPGFFPVQRRDGARRIGLDRVERAGSADERNDLRADPPSPTVRKLAATPYESGANVPLTAAPFKTSRYTRHMHTRD